MITLDTTRFRENVFSRFSPIAINVKLCASFEENGVIVVFPGHTHLLFLVEHISSKR